MILVSSGHRKILRLQDTMSFLLLESPKNFVCINKYNGMLRTSKRTESEYNNLDSQKKIKDLWKDNRSLFLRGGCGLKEGKLLE